MQKLCCFLSYSDVSVTFRLQTGALKHQNVKQLGEGQTGRLAWCSFLLLCHTLRMILTLLVWSSNVAASGIRNTSLSLMFISLCGRSYSALCWMLQMGAKKPDLLVEIKLKTLNVACCFLLAFRVWNAQFVVLLGHLKRSHISFND